MVGEFTQEQAEKYMPKKDYKKAFWIGGGVLLILLLFLFFAGKGIAQTVTSPTFTPRTPPGTERGLYDHKMV